MSAIQNPPTGIARLIAPGWDAAKQNWRPFILIQATALVLVFVYYQSQALRDATVGIGQVKLHGGLWFSAAATAFAGVALPEVAKRLTVRGRRRITVGDFVFQCAFFAILGMMVDLWYRLMALLLGTSVDWHTVATKVVIDMGCFSVLGSIPFSTISFLWRDEGFDFAKTKSELKNGAFPRRYWPVMITCWAYWLPCLVAVYAMPRDLQFCLFLCVHGAWSLLLVHMTSERANAAAKTQ